MTTNRIRELREGLGLSQEELGARVGTNKFKISRLENEDTRLDLEIAKRIAQALNVGLAEVLGVEGGEGISEDAVAYHAGPHDPLYPLADASKGRALFKVQTNVLDENGIRSGDVLLIDATPSAIEKLKPLAIVLVEMEEHKNGAPGMVILRQFVPPSLLITNSRQDNRSPINLSTTTARIRGVVISRHHQFTMAWA